MSNPNPWDAVSAPPGAPQRPDPRTMDDPWTATTDAPADRPTAPQWFGPQDPTSPTVAPVQPGNPEPTAEAASGFPSTYTVQAGDTLPSIARALYGHESNWTRLLAANADSDAYLDADGFADPELAGFTGPLEVAGVVLSTSLERQPKRLRQRPRE